MLKIFQLFREAKKFNKPLRRACRNQTHRKYHLRVKNTELVLNKLFDKYLSSLCIASSISFFFHVHISLKHRIATALSFGSVCTSQIFSNKIFVCNPKHIACWVDSESNHFFTETQMLSDAAFSPAKELHRGFHSNRDATSPSICPYVLSY